MISFTAFKLFIAVVYVWFAIGIVVISVFAVRELFAWFRADDEESCDQNIPKGHQNNYEM